MNNFLNPAHNLVITGMIPALRTIPITGLLVEENGVNALHLAAAAENVNAIMLIAERFRENDISINIPDANGNTILHHIGAFTEEDDAAVIHTLLGMMINLYGANITVQNNAGDTALHFAIYYSNQAVATYLIHTQLLAAIDTGLHPRIAHLLIRNNIGYNPLHAAVETLVHLQDNDDRLAIRNIIIQFLTVMEPQDLNELTNDQNNETALDIANDLDLTDPINLQVRGMLIARQARGVSPATARRSPTAHMNYIDDEI
tara:strand:- start:151 stop:927 length:777 start_codon:yes stop_codon:yes gene_type:complete